MYSTMEKVKIVDFYEGTYQLWQHNESFISTIIFVIRLHPRLLKVLSLNLKLYAQFSISKEGHLADLKNASLLKILKLSGTQKN